MPTCFIPGKTHFFLKMTRVIVALRVKRERVHLKLIKKESLDAACEAGEPRGSRM